MTNEEAKLAEKDRRIASLEADATDTALEKRELERRIAELEAKLTYVPDSEFKLLEKVTALETRTAAGMALLEHLSHEYVLGTQRWVHTNPQNDLCIRCQLFAALSEPAVTPEDGK